jgi:hypothetical protein
MAHSPHRRTKGCPLCNYHKFKDHGRAEREPWSVIRQIGKRRRITRNDLGDR